MKKIILFLFLLCGFAYSQNPEDLPDFTLEFSMRMGISGDLILPDTPNWNLKQVELSEEILKTDPYRSFGLDSVQFVNTKNPSMCLAIDESGLFTLKSCEEDLRSQKLESVFSIIPTTSSAVQIRSFVLDKNECIAFFFNPSLLGGSGIGINPCSVDGLLSIPEKNIVLIVPPLRSAKIVDNN